MSKPNTQLADLELSRRLERAEGQTNAAMIDARARLFPSSGARRLTRGGAFALFDGVGSPLTQTFCLGMTEAPRAEDFDEIEHFFMSRGAEVSHEVSPLADGTTLAMLNARGYQPIEFTSIMFREIHSLAATADTQSPISVRIAGSTEHDLWTETAARGWGEHAELADFLRDIGQVSAACEGVTSFLAEVAGQPAGSGALSIRDGVALLAGASTVPEFRNRGAQLTLLEARLRYAAEHGCDLAMMGASPGSGSQRNAERRGFRIAYTRVKWRLPA